MHMGTTPPPPIPPGGGSLGLVAGRRGIPLFDVLCRVCFCVSRCVAQIMTMVMSCCYCFKRK